MCKFFPKLILLEGLLNLHEAVSIVSVYLLLDDDLDLVEHILLTERLQGLLVLLRVALEQVVYLAETGHHRELVI
jgi:hypothetical protein